MFLFICGFSASASDLKFSEVKERLFDKEVVIRSSTANLGGRSVMLDWFIFEGGDRESIKPSRRTQLGQERNGAQGRVVDVQLYDPEPSRQPIFPSATIDPQNPRVLVVVKLSNEDLLVAYAGAASSLLTHNISPIAQVNSLKTEIERNLKELTGKTLYSAGFSKLIDPTISADAIGDHRQRNRLRLRVNNLLPMKIVEGKYLESQNAIVLMVELPDKRNALIYGDVSHYNLAREYKATKLDRMGISEEESIPKKFTSKEVNAIKKGLIVTGMSEDALFWAAGYPENTNNWGTGGYQYVYFGGNLYVYVRGKRVTDFQSLD